MKFVPHIPTLQIIYNLHSINQVLTVLMAFTAFIGIHHVRDDISELIVLFDVELKKRKVNNIKKIKIWYS